MIKMGSYIGRGKVSGPREGFIPNPKLKLLEQVSGDVAEHLKRVKLLHEQWKHGVGVAGAQRCFDHANLHARDGQAGIGRSKPVG
jgi:hypothetical protein